MYKKLLIIILLFSITVAAGLNNRHHKAFANTYIKINKDCPTIDNSHVIISASDCGTNNGSIVDLVANNITGDAVWTWYDMNNNVVGHNADLNNVGPGTYKVTLKDDSKCPAVAGLYIVGLNNPLKINDINLVIKPPTCGLSDGAVTGLQFNSPPVSFKWASIDNPTKVLSTQKDLLNVPAGNYQLTVVSATNCTAQETYKVFPVGGFPIMTYYHYTNSDCGASGSFQATFDIKSTEPSYIYTIDDLKGNTIHTGQLAYSPAKDSVRIAILPGAPSAFPPITAMPPGTYTLNIINSTCRITYLTFTIGLDKIKLDTSGLHITSNVCGNQTGQITGLDVKGGLATYVKDPDPTHGWFWVDSIGKRENSRFGFLGNVPAGKYRVWVVNMDGCSSDTMTFAIPDSVGKTTKPILSDVKMCLPGTAAIEVQNKDTSAHYKLYDSEMMLIDSSRGGYFAKKVTQTTVFYVQATHGYCGSPLGKITVTVVNPGVSLPNAFTPNGDGTNDLWNITGLDQYPGTEIMVFNRLGQRVYHSINYTNPFDGRFNGKPLPDGVYYYIVDTKKPDCRGGITGSLTILR